MVGEFYLNRAVLFFKKIKKDRGGEEETTRRLLANDYKTLQTLKKKINHPKEVSLLNKPGILHTD